jgi:hypothetical protein
LISALENKSNKKWWWILFFVYILNSKGF